MNKMILIDQEIESSGQTKDVIVKRYIDTEFDTQQRHMGWLRLVGSLKL